MFFGFLINKYVVIFCCLLFIGILKLFKCMSKLVNVVKVGNNILIWKRFVLDINGFCLFCILIKVINWFELLILNCIVVLDLLIRLNFKIFL